MVDTSFNIASEELQVAQITQLNQFFFNFWILFLYTATASMRLVVYLSEKM